MQDHKYVLLYILLDHDHLHLVLIHLHPRLNELNPPGGASLRVVDLPVITFPLF